MALRLAVAWHGAPASPAPQRREDEPHCSGPGHASRLIRRAVRRRASKARVDAPLQAQGIIGRPMAPMPVMGGVRDTPAPIADTDRLPRSGETPKEAWINPAGAHMGREPKGCTDPVIPAHHHAVAAARARGEGGVVRARFRSRAQFRHRARAAVLLSLTPIQTFRSVPAFHCLLRTLAARGRKLGVPGAGLVQVSIVGAYLSSASSQQRRLSYRLPSPRRRRDVVCALFDPRTYSPLTNNRSQ